MQHHEGGYYIRLLAVDCEAEVDKVSRAAKLTGAEDVRVFRPPVPQPAIVGRQALSDHYAAHRFNLPGLHAALLGRLVFGNKVIDQERIVGVGEQPIDAAAVYEVNAAGLIAAVWFFNAS